MNSRMALFSFGMIAVLLAIAKGNVISGSLILDSEYHETLSVSVDTSFVDVFN